MIKRGSRVVLKFDVKSAVAGDVGRVSSRTSNGWLRIKIHRINEMITVRNGLLRLDRPFYTKWNNGFGCQPTAHSWWLPFNSEPLVSKVKINKLNGLRPTPIITPNLYNPDDDAILISSTSE